MPRLGTLLRMERNAKRLTEIIKVLTKYGLGEWLNGLNSSWIQERLRSHDGQRIADLSTSQCIRHALTELGTTFIKLGQVLSTRPDVVGPDLATELNNLHASTPADSAEKVRKIFTEDFDKAPEALFASFDETPFASASIAQVHSARLHTGQAVVVKVKHSDIDERVLSDIDLLAALAELAETHSEQLRLYQPRSIVRQFRRIILRELDLGFERRNIEEFRRNFSDDPMVHFPRTWDELSSKRVLTMERLIGVTGSDPGALEECGADLDEFARRGANMFLEMLFRDSFYHADPHPGNLMLLPGGVVGVLDCGMVGRLDEALRDEIETLLMAVAQKDSRSLTDVVLRLGSVPEDFPRSQLRTELDEFLADYVGSSLKALDLSGALRSLTGIIRRYGIVLPPSISMLLKMLIVLEGTSRRLSPDFSLAELIGTYWIKIAKRRFSPERIFSRIRRTYRDWDRLLETFPRDFGEMLSRLRDGRLNVRLNHRHLDPVVNRLVLGIVDAAIFLGSSLLWSSAAPPVVWGVSLFGAMGYIVAVYLGWRLLRSIRKSGDLGPGK